MPPYATKKLKRLVCKFANGISPEITNEIFQLTENHYNVRHLCLFIVSLMQSAYNGTKTSTCLGFKQRIKSWKPNNYPCGLWKFYIHNILVFLKKSVDFVFKGNLYYWEFVLYWFCFHLCFLLYFIIGFEVADFDQLSFYKKYFFYIDTRSYVFYFQLCVNFKQIDNNNDNSNNNNNNNNNNLTLIIISVHRKRYGNNFKKLSELRLV